MQLARVGNAGDELNADCLGSENCAQTVLETALFMDEFYIYIGIFGVWLLLGILTSLQYVNITMNTSQNVHDLSIGAVIRTSMDFFHANPTGRIMNRFTKDMGIVDSLLIEDSNETIYCTFLLIGIMIIKRKK